MFSKYLETGKTDAELLDEAVTKILSETKTPKETKKEALKKLGLNAKKIQQLLNERNGEGKTYKCPECGKPTAIANHLGWRNCTECGWEERSPNDLEEVQEDEHLTEETEKARLKKVMKELGINSKEIELLLNETSTTKDSKKKTLKLLGLEDKQIKKLLNESEKTVQCPHCDWSGTYQDGDEPTICPNCEKSLKPVTESVSDPILDTTVQVGGKTFKAKKFTNEKETNDFLAANEKDGKHTYGVIKVEGNNIYVARNEDLGESVMLKECVVEMQGYKYDVEIMDGTHIRMKSQGTDKWGTPLHFMQVQPEVIYQLKQQGKAKGQFFVADQDRNKELKSESADSKPAKYQVWQLEVWGNETDGWETNDKFKVGVVTLNDALEGDEADEEVLKALKEKDLLNKALTLKDITIDMPDDMVINVDDAKDGKFLYELIKENE